jgi:bifunctional non-homologous end joining protein LigD
MSSRDHGRLCGWQQAPSGPDWVHEIKHDGHRLIVRRDGKVMRLFTRRGHDWTDRYPAIAAAAAKLRAKSFTLGGGGLRRGRVSDAILQAFDLLEMDGVDDRPLQGRASTPHAHCCH